MKTNTALSSSVAGKDIRKP